ncbi:MAG TPA: glycosyltransferase family 39 protein [Crinalium sp.]|jgi:4-amino-4-deoxy-L-arabinose transferase-like glycosyltransferase
MNIQNRRFSFYCLIAILILAAILRFNHITQPFTDYINWRQASTAMMAENYYRRNWNIFFPEISWDGPGPSYNGREFQTVTYLAALIYRVVGQHDWVGRSIAVLFGLWGIFALYQLVRRVWGEKHALLSAAVMALIPGSIYFDRSFLPDPAMVSLVVTSVWMFVAYLQTERSRYLLLASVIGCWGFLTKITGLIVGIPMLYALGAIWIAQRKLANRQFLLIISASILTLLPVTAYYLWAKHLATHYPPYHFAGGGNWLWDNGLQSWLKEQYFLPGAVWVFDTWLWTKPIIVLVLLGLIIRPPHHQYNHPSAPSPELANTAQKNSAPWLFHWWIMAGIIYYLIGAKELVPNSWNFHILNPAAAALSAHAILSLASFFSKHWKPATLVTVALSLFLIGAIGHYGLKTVYNPSSPSLNATQSYKLGLALRQISQPDDLVVTVANDIGSPIAIYYSRRRGWTFPPAINDIDWSKLPEDDQISIRAFETLRDKGADWLGIVAEHFEEIWGKHPKLVKHIETTCQFQAKSQDWVIYRIPSSGHTTSISN